MIFNPAMVGERIHCPKCQSTDWRCWDEWTVDCWHPDGSYAGVQVIGGLACNLCGTDWQDISVDPGDDCDCDD